MCKTYCNEECRECRYGPFFDWECEACKQKINTGNSVPSITWKKYDLPKIDIYADTMLRGYKESQWRHHLGYSTCW